MEEFSIQCCKNYSTFHSPYFPVTTDGTWFSQEPESFERKCREQSESRELLKPFREIRVATAHQNRKVVKLS